MKRSFQHHGRGPIIGLLAAGLLLALFSWGPLRNRLNELAKYDAGLSANITARQGGSQMVAANTAFPGVLQAVVTDVSGNAVSGATVMFSAPASGPSATFDGVLTASVPTDSSGVATAPPLIANSLDGGYTVTANVVGAGEAPAYFSLMNTPGTQQGSPSGVSGARIQRAPRMNIVVFEGLVLLAVFYFLSTQLTRKNQADRLFSFLVTLGLSISVFTVLATFAREDYFAPLETLMTKPISLSVYGQRLLLVWLADAVKLLVPSLSYRRCYLATQFLATLAAIYMIGQWAVLIVGKQWKLLSQLLFVAMLIPTITYGTFYDIAMVCIYATALFLLRKRQYYAFVATVAIGTLNHENTLLLVPVAAFVLWGAKPWRISLGVPFAAFAAWVAVRLTIQRFIPETSHFDLHLWTNLVSLSHPSAELIKSFASLIFWWLCAAIGFQSASQFVRRATILLPALIAVTAIAGRFVEARQFDAFIPLTIVLILSHFNNIRGTAGIRRSDTRLAAESVQSLAVGSTGARHAVTEHEHDF
jgi:hypothetical protein